jgi:flavin-dependent dehydrogenase
MSESYDLIVIGGGPAGTSAAITAARGGSRVLLLERGRFPRHKVCGEFISAESLVLLGWLLAGAKQDLLDQSLRLSESHVLLDGRSLRIPIDPPAASISRYDLDLALWDAARKAGVNVLAETTAQPIESEHPFRIQTSAGNFLGRAVINASGRWSNLNVGASPTQGIRWLGLKAHFHGPVVERSVDLYFFNGGYCGVLPVRGPDGGLLINACALFRPGVTATFEDLFPRHPILHARSRQWTPAFAPLSTFPVTFPTPRSVSGLIPNTGDAAGFVDPFVGDGIALALRSGHLAASSLLPFLRGDWALGQALHHYADGYRRSLLPVYRASSRFRKLLLLPRIARTPLLSAFASSSWLRRYLVDSTRSKLQTEFGEGRLGERLSAPPALP